MFAVHVKPRQLACRFHVKIVFPASSAVIVITPRAFVRRKMTVFQLQRDRDEGGAFGIFRRFKTGLNRLKGIRRHVVMQGVHFQRFTNLRDIGYGQASAVENNSGDKEPNRDNVAQDTKAVFWP